MPVDFSPIGSPKSKIRFTPVGQAAASAIPEPPPAIEEPSTWEKINSGLISPNVISEVMTGSPTGFTEARDAPPYEGESRLHAGLRAGIAGAGQSASETLSSFTSPASLAMMGLGALGEASSSLPRLAQTARALLTGAGLGYGAQGAVQTAQAAPGALEGKPEEAQKALLGMSQMAAAAPAVSTAARAIKPSRATIQSALGIGKRMTEQATAKAEAANEAEIAATNERNRLEIEKTEHMNKVADEQYEAKATEVGEKNKAAQRQYAQDLREQKQEAAEIARMNQQRRAAYDEAVEAVRTANEQSKAAAAQRLQLFGEMTDNSAKLGTAIKDLGKQVRETGAAKFEEVAKATEGAVADPTTLREAVQHAEKNILKGSPESIKIFKNILDAATPEEGPVATSAGKAEPGTPFYQRLVDIGAVSPPETIGFRDLHGYYSELGQKASGGNLPGDVYQALKYVREQGVGKEMARIAEEHGVADKLADARSYWRNYIKTFIEERAISRGGSPVAKLYRAVDPDLIVTTLKGPAGARAREMIAAYDPKLASLAGRIRAMGRHIETLPEVAKEQALPKEPTAKKIPAPPSEPEMKAAPEMPEGKVPELRLPQLESVDPQALKQKAIQKMADHALSSGDWRMVYDLHALGVSAWSLFAHMNPLYAAGMMLYPVGRRVFGMTLNRPSISQWLSQPSPEELGLPKTKRPPVSFKGTAAQSIAGRKEARGFGLQRIPPPPPPGVPFSDVFPIPPPPR